MVVYVVGAPVITALAGRLPRRRLLVALDVLRSGSVVGMPLATEAWHVYVLIVLVNACSAGFTPTFQATIPDLLTDERAQSTGDGAQPAPPEALDLVEAGIAQRSQLRPQREVAVLIGPHREVAARLGLGDAVVRHPRRHAVEHERGQERVVGHGGVEVEEHPAGRERLVNRAVERRLRLEVVDVVQRKRGDHRVRCGQRPALR
jgi:hypothetical protein